MPRHMILLYLVLAAQILLLSVVQPWLLARRVRFLIETYPPSEYPRMYPKPLASVERSLRLYWLCNALIVGTGLALLAISWGSEELLNWDSGLVITAYFLLQLLPLALVAKSGFPYFHLERGPDSPATRTADLRPRRLFDFLSPAMVALAIVVYLAFVGLVLYIDRFDYPWFGGYWNIVGITLANLFFVGLIFRALHARRTDPYKTERDREREIGLTIKSLAFTSITATLYIGLAIISSALEMRYLSPIFFSLYCTAAALVGLRSLRVDRVDFEVYKADPAPSRAS